MLDSISAIFTYIFIAEMSCKIIALGIIGEIKKTIVFYMLQSQKYRLRKRQNEYI